MDKNIPPIPPEDLELIGRYSRKAIPPEELYTFPLILCDNEIDRDGEKFTVDSLAKLAEMFRGKTGIFDHNPSGKEQTARIYSASLETDHARTAADGEPYTFVRAMAYMVRSEKNRDLIAEIDAGIKKETSVCCKVDAVRCSVCGKDIRRGPCPHEKGKEYDGKICCHLLCDPCDAYEWSFVAVPAQRNAGVTKSFQLSEMPSDDGVKSLRGEVPSCDGVKCIDSQCDSGSEAPILNDESLQSDAVGNDVLGVPHTTGCGASHSPDEVGFHCGGRNFTSSKDDISPRAHSARSDFTERKALISSLLPKSAPLPKEDTSVYII